MADEALAVQRTNLTTGIIEEVHGRDLYDTDYPGGSIAESAKIRSESFLVKGDREKCLEAGATDYISKPINLEQLFSVMRVWLTK